MCKHHLLFFEDHYPAQQASDFLVAGLEAGDRGLLLLTQPHRQAVERCLRMRGVRYKDACVFVDTDEVVAQIRASGFVEEFLRARGQLVVLRALPAGAGVERLALHAAMEIDGTLGALAVWKNYKQNKSATIQQYKNALQLGYTKSIGEIYSAAGVKFDFSQEYISSLAQFILQEIENLNGKA